ncbi:MAG TPA: pitrilysin family protein [Bacteroidia bacterium]|nr:pitrilysin family protein [Bacteroidia bacterium]
MVEFEKFELDNGLKVIVNTDMTTPLVAMNILYKVGARDESPDKTGFAHLFEHLMFGGSVNIENYDEPLQRAGGENNAFTNNDFTNYYLTIPAPNLETAFWLESDRMLSLAFSANSLNVQRHVVVEEFRQRYLNQPYGDTWLLLRPLAYKVHPYQWATIGKEVSHIENATLEDVKSFFSKHYHPANAILTLSGNITVETAKELSEKWFGPIPKGTLEIKKIQSEPQQKEKRTLTVEREVPYDAIYKAWHSCSRDSADFYATDLLTDILSGGKSSRLYNSLVKDKKVFSSISAYTMGDLDPGLVVTEGKLVSGVNPQDAEMELDLEIGKIVNEAISEREMNKVRQKAESGLIFGEMNHANRALNLAYFEMLGDAELINNEIDAYRNVSATDIKRIATEIFREENSSVLYYLSKK